MGDMKDKMKKTKNKATDEMKERMGKDRDSEK